MLRLSRARAINGTPDAVRLFRLHRIARRIAQRMSPRTATAWLEALGRYRTSIDLKELRTALASRDLQTAMAAIRASGFGRMMRDLEDPIASAVIASGQTTAEVLIGKGVNVHFQTAHPNVILFARDHAAAMLTEVTETTREAVRVVIALGAQEGMTIQQQATAIREVVGLPTNWVHAPFNLAREIRDGDLAALGARRLSAVDMARIRSRINQENVTEAFVEEMRQRYADSLHNARALMIARTETMRAANFGHHEAFIQAMREGELSPEVRRFWIVTEDDKLSEEHATIPDMNPDGRGLEEPFETTEGPCMYPPSRPNCRCGVGIGVPDA